MTNTGLSALEIQKAAQAQDNATRPVVIAALIKHLNEKGKPYKITPDNRKFGSYDWTLEVDGKVWYCELKTRSDKYNSKSFDGDLFTVDKIKRIKEETNNTNNILFFAAFNSDKTILVYDVMKTIADRKCDMAVMKTEQNTVNKGFNMVDKSFYNLHKKAAFLKLKL